MTIIRAIRGKCKICGHPAYGANHLCKERFVIACPVDGCKCGVADSYEAVK